MVESDGICLNLCSCFAWEMKFCASLEYSKTFFQENAFMDLISGI